MAISPVDRVLAKVRKTADGHWIYTGAHDKDGYGVIRTGSRTADNRRMRFAHEIVAEHYHKTEAAGPNFDWDHRCGVRACVNPKHLERVSKAVNLNRRRY